MRVISNREIKKEKKRESGADQKATRVRRIMARGKVDRRYRFIQRSKDRSDRSERLLRDGGNVIPDLCLL